MFTSTYVNTRVPTYLHTRTCPIPAYTAWTAYLRALPACMHAMYVHTYITYICIYIYRYM